MARALEEIEEGYSEEDDADEDVLPPDPESCKQHWKFCENTNPL